MFRGVVPLKLGTFWVICRKGVWIVAKGDGLEAGFQDGRQFLRSLKRKRINNQALATILNLTLTHT